MGAWFRPVVVWFSGAVKRGRHWGESGRGWQKGRPDLAAPPPALHPHPLPHALPKPCPAMPLFVPATAWCQRHNTATSTPTPAKTKQIETKQTTTAPHTTPRPFRCTHPT